MESQRSWKVASLPGVQSTPSLRTQSGVTVKHDSVENPSMVMRMLRETFDLTGGRLPFQSICKAVQNKIDAGETMKKSAAMVLAQPLQVPAPKFQDKEKLQEFENKEKRSTSRAPSWDLVMHRQQLHRDPPTR